MKKQWINALIGLTACFKVYANIIDIHGINNEAIGARIIQKYEQQISKTEKALFEAGKTLQGSKDFEQMFEKRTELIDTIKKEFGLLYVDFQTLFYDTDRDLYTTIEVVRKDEAERMRFISVPDRSKISDKPKKDLIESMREYLAKSFSAYVQGRLKPSASCPVYHCFMGFEAPELKPYLALFNERAVKEKQLILNTLKNDPDDDRRHAAQFLIGHFKDPHEIIRLLGPYVQDKSTGIRNNSIRIIAMTMETAKIYKIDLRPFIQLLDAATVTDRNKSLYLLSVAAKSPSNHKIILEGAGDNLLKLLALKQPNNHDTSYQILKQLSGKDFGEHDLAAWKNWLKEARAKLA